MAYRVELTKRAQKQLHKMDQRNALLITRWMRKNLEGCENPRQYGKPLTGDRLGQWRYRVGEYRIIAEIYDDRVLIMVMTVGHRKEVYGL